MVALWFVHDLISLNNKTDLAMLFYVQEADMNEGIDSIVETSFAELPKGQDKIVGTFVKRERNGLVPANSFPIAKRAFFLSNLYRGRLIKRYGETQTSKNCQIKAEYSYHVNVGHGNCSILVVKNNNQYQLWMVDCSNHDYLNKQFYTSNIEKSIMHIMSTFKLQSFNISKLFLTHYHYDHYSGINWLINKGYLSNSEIWMNFHYSWPEPKFIRLLINLNQMNCKFCEPKVSNSISGISIWHPDETVVRSITSKYSDLQNIREERNPNNSSVVLQLGNSNQTIVFPGDIDTPGLNRIRSCQPHLRNAKFYCVSHHGSQNGHERTICPLGKPVANVSQCAGMIDKAILMGRDGAYSGIYSNNVIQDFGNRLIYSEKDGNSRKIAFVEINLSNSNVQYYY